MSSELSAYPGGDLVAKGLEDLKEDRLSEEALLVLIASPRLARLGFHIAARAEGPKSYEHLLYEAIELRNSHGAHATYNGLIGRIVSFVQTYRVG